MKNLDKVYVLVAGGTGGHLFPAMSLASALSKEGKHVVLFTDERAGVWSDSKDIERTWIFRLNRARGGWCAILFFFRLFVYGFKSIGLFLKDRPAVVIGFGSYVSSPVVLAAQILHIPTILHEQNAVLGRANQLLSKYARCVASGAPNVQKLNKKKQVFVGNPVREEIKKLYQFHYEPPVVDGPVNILVLGGSQGAEIFSHVVPPAMVSLPEAIQKRVKICQQTRKKWIDRNGLFYKKSFLEVNLCEFFTNMPALLKWAHLVIARAGASSLAEFAVAGKPSILIPFAQSRDGDQLYNARYYQTHGAAEVVEESNFSPELLNAILLRLIQDPSKLNQMSQAARSLAKLDASQKLADIAMNFAI